MPARFRSLVRNLFHHKLVERELDAELDSFVQEQAQRKMAQGLSLDEAMRQARVQAGGVEQVKEQVRGVRAGFWLETFWNDLRHGARGLRRSPGFALACILTFALGIGANTAIFSMVNALVFRPIHAEKPEQLTYLVAYKNFGSSNEFSYPNFMEVRQESHGVFDDIAGLHEFQMEGMNSGGKSRTIWVDYVTTNFFSVMGVKPELGSFFAQDQKLVGHDQAIVLTHSFWKSQFNGDPNEVGKKIAIDGQPLTIAGVTSEGFTGTTTFVGVQAFLPIGIAGQLQNQEIRDIDRRDRPVALMIGRLKDGTNLERANTAMPVIAQRLAAEDPKYNKDIRIRVVALGIGLTNSTGKNPLPTISSLFLTLASLVLALAGANVANLLLVRTVTRSREMAMRTALGAARSRLIRQVMTETLLLAILGGAGGVALGGAVSGWVGSMHLDMPGVPLILNFSMDWRVYSYAFAAALLAAIIGGVAPAWRASAVDVRNVMREGSAQTSPRGQRFRTMLVAGQVAVSLALVIVAGLFVRSLWHVQRADLGFDPLHVMNFSMDTHGAGYNESRGQHFYNELLERMSVLPHVEAASLTNAVPLGEEVFGSDLQIEGAKDKSKTRPAANYSGISPNFLKTMRIALLRGRMFTSADDARSQKVAIINQRMAEKFWPGEDPIGKRFKRLDDPDTSHVVEVVGVAHNAQVDDILGQEMLHFFIPIAQDYKSKQTLQLRTAGEPAALAGPVMEIIHQMDATMPVYDVTAMTTVLNGINGLFLFRLGAGLAALLGGLGLVLAVIGLYGVISYSAAQRTREIGIRMALGAQRNQIVSGILKQGLVILAIGVALGGPAAAGIGQVASTFLVGISGLDPMTYVCVSLLLAAIAIIATLIPALRATKVDPMIALRCD